jgi:flagellar hook-basal body complex protein FliE
MNIGGIDSSRIEAMMAQLKAAATKPAAPSLGGRRAVGGRAASAAWAGGAEGVESRSSKVSFSDALKARSSKVSNSQNQADDMGKKFAMGDDSVSLSDTMIAMQKSSITFQATVQVRNKLVSAYHDIMNMQVCCSARFRKDAVDPAPMAQARRLREDEGFPLEQHWRTKTVFQLWNCRQ